MRRQLLAWTMGSLALAATGAAAEEAVGSAEPAPELDYELLGEAEDNPDPWEGFNRRVFAFNESADRWVLKPVARTYHELAPSPVETGVSNFFANLGEVNNFLNNLLQGKFKGALTDLSRFVINSTLGAVGLIDVATEMGLQRNNEDFGQTLGYWGVSSGPYLVVPLLGPRTVRDGLGNVPDIYANPLTYMDHTRTRNSIAAGGAVSLRASLLETEKLIRGDRYIFMRDAYLQRREFLVRDGEVEDDFGEEEFDDDWEW